MSRKVFAHILVSVDGYIEGPQGELDWPFVDVEFEQYIVRMLSSIDGMILGRRAYEGLSQYWPNAEANPAPADNLEALERQLDMARMMNALPKYVASRTLERTAWRNSEIVADLEARTKELKQEDGRDIAAFAGAEVISSLTQADLLDEFWLFVHPALLGGGKRLFQASHPIRQLRLLETRPFASGALLLRYGR